MNVANLFDMITQTAQGPTNFIEAYQAGVSRRMAEEDRQLQRQQLIQQIEGLIQDNRQKKVKSVLMEEELGPQATKQRQLEREAGITKSKADIEFIPQERKLGVAQTRQQISTSKAQEASAYESIASSKANRALTALRAENEKLDLYTKQATMAGNISAINAANEQQAAQARLNTQVLNNPTYKDMYETAELGKMVGDTIKFATKDRQLMATQTSLDLQLEKNNVDLSNLPTLSLAQVSEAKASILKAQEFLNNGNVRAAEAAASQMEAIIRRMKAEATVPLVTSIVEAEHENLLVTIEETKARTEEIKKGTVEPVGVDRLTQGLRRAVASGDIDTALNIQGEINAKSNIGPTESVRTELQKDNIAIDEFSNTATELLKTDLDQVGLVSDVKSTLKGALAQLSAAGIPDSDGVVTELRSIMKDPKADEQRANLALLAVKLAATLPGAEKASAARLMDLSKELLGAGKFADPAAVRAKIGTFLAEAYERKFQNTNTLTPNILNELPDEYVQGVRSMREAFLSRIRNGTNPDEAKKAIYDLADKYGINRRLLGIE